mmetsp:Transcript_27745/g.70722  ORF Transcript_27745/g.70722 Transcript_27745/m.70722 type:complete len:285 (-) Transcript_27745:299-1153(-)
MALLLLLAVCMVMCISVSSQPPKIAGYSVIAEYPHDPQAFTQGIQFDRSCDNDSKECCDVFWESTGLYGQSTVRQVVVNTGEVKQSVKLDARWFGEGLVKLGDMLYQLTWQTGTIFKFRVEGGQLKQVGQVAGPLRDGWGLATDGKLLIATDSSADVALIDPDTMKLVRKVTVKDEGRPVKWLNELEVIDGELWANVWQTECIAVIDLATGRVKQWVLLHGLRHGLHQRHPKHHDMDVLNGIAYDAVGKRLFVTGKKWPRVFEVVPGPHPGHMTLDEVRAQCIK